MIREYKESDLKQIEKLHTGEFVLPNLEHPLMLVRRCMVDEDDRVRMAAFGRLHVNALLFVDRTWLTPAERLEKLKELHGELFAEARGKGIDIATAQMDGRFAERMKDFGWIEGFGQMFYREIP